MNSPSPSPDEIYADLLSRARATQPMEMRKDEMSARVREQMRQQEAGFRFDGQGVSGRGRDWTIKPDAQS